MSSLVRVCSLATVFTGWLSAASAGSYGRPPITFEWRGAEAGGHPAVARISGHKLSFGASGTVREISAGNSPKPLLRFAGARPNVWPRIAGPPAGRANYFLGSRPEQWQTGIPLFQKIKYADLYPGIDLIYYGNQNRLEYDLVVRPGVSWRSIRLAFGEDVEIDQDGNLRLPAGFSWVIHGPPVVYQGQASDKREVIGKYVRRGRNQIGFKIGAHDPGIPLIIDPTLAFASYLGGSGDDYGHAVAVSGAGCAYLVGETNSEDLTAVGSAQGHMAGASDVFISKWNPAGTGLVYSTYIGGSSRDAAFGVAVDPAGNAYVTGFTYSADFPITPGALRASFAGNSKAFVLKLNPNGNALVYSTFLGGSGDDYGAGITVDAAGQAHIAGYTASVDFPTTTGALQRHYGGGFYDGFLAKLNAAGSGLLYATYLGGTANDTAAGVALDPSGNIYIAGQTQSSNFPVFNPLQATNDESDAFVVKMNSAGQLIYATYLGGTGLTNGTGIAADSAGNAYVTGFTSAQDFPVTGNAYQAVNNGIYDAFVAVLSTYGSSIVSATYLGGSASDASYGIAVDASGDVLIAGSTSSIDFPAWDAPQPAYNGTGDGFIAGFNNDLSCLLYATYFGGGGSDIAAGVAVDVAGNAYITGYTGSGESSIGLPVTSGVFQSVGMGGVDTFLAKIAMSGDDPQLPAVSTGRALGITGSTAMISGAVNPNGAATELTFSYGTDSSMLDCNSTPAQKIDASANTLPVNAGLTGLAPNTTYYFQASASNSAGSARGQVMSFTTAPASVTVTVTSSPAGALFGVLGMGCAPGNYTTPANLIWSAGAVCSVGFTDPQMMYEFQSATVNGSASSHANPLVVNSPGGGTLSINAVFGVLAPSGPGAATHFAVSAASGATAGLPIRFTVTALDATNHMAAGYTDAVRFTSTDSSAALPGDALLTGGVGTFSVVLDTVGTSLLTVSDLRSPGITGTSGNITVSQSSAGLRFVSLRPCRVVDTRDTSKPAGLGPPAIAGGTAMDYSILNGPCGGIPPSAQAYSFNVTVVPRGVLGYLTVWPTGQPRPLTSTLNSLDGEVKANATIVAAGSNGAVSVYATNNTDVILDINGYFVPSSSNSGLAFYAMEPCRLVDTRPNMPSSIISGTLVAGSNATLPILSSGCNVPSTAQAYSLNFTLVPPAAVGYLTVWPAGQNRPVVSTLNDPTGAVEANAAIAPAGTGGSINVFVTDKTELVVDINGYFAPPGDGGLSLYALPPCRVLDTRMPAGSPPFSGAIDVNVNSSGCGGTGTAQAYVFNATVVPPGMLGYLTLWPEGSAQPVVSTLNAYSGVVTSNMAIVPTNNTEVSAFAHDRTQLVLDIFGYFAP